MQIQYITDEHKKFCSSLVRSKKVWQNTAPMSARRRHQQLGSTCRHTNTNTNVDENTNINTNMNTLRNMLCLAGSTDECLSLSVLKDLLRPVLDYHLLPNLAFPPFCSFLITGTQFEVVPVTHICIEYLPYFFFRLNC